MYNADISRDFREIQDPNSDTTGEATFGRKRADWYSTVHQIKQRHKKASNLNYIESCASAYDFISTGSIAVFGSGLSGMLTALAFANLGIKVTVFETHSVEDASFFSDVRTTALTASSKDFLTEIGIWDSVQAIASNITDIYVADNKAPEMLHFCLQETLPNAEKAMGHVVKNSEFKKLLLNELRRNSLISLFDKCDYQVINNTDTICQIALNGEVLDFDLLVLCNGPFSKVRERYFSNNIMKYYDQTAFTFNIKHKKAHEGTAIEHFMPSGPFAILPLKDQYTSNIVWSVRKDYVLALKHLPSDEFKHIVQQNIGDVLGEVVIDSAIGIFPLRACIARQYFYNRIVLVADSAHIVHPLAGQGLNQGIKDIKELTRLVETYGANYNTLAEYQERRQDDNLHMYNITDSLNRLFSNDNKALKFVRNIGFNLINKIPQIRNQLIQYAMGKH